MTCLSKSRFVLAFVLLILGTAASVAPVLAADDDGCLLPQIFKDLQDLGLQYLRPGQVKERLAQTPVIYIPVGPIEWHGLHMPMGPDPLNAQTVALATCRITGGAVWPTLYFGAATLRSPEQSRKLYGLEGDHWVWSVDLPNNIIPSAFCSDDMLAMIVREAVREASQMGAKLVIIISGHGAGAHMQALERVALEVSADTETRVKVRGAWAVKPLYPEKDGHACAAETSLMMAETRAVDLKQLPPLPELLRYPETGVVDDWSSTGRTGYSVTEGADPRTSAAAGFGKEIVNQVADEIASEIKMLLSDMQSGN